MNAFRDRSMSFLLTELKKKALFRGDSVKITLSLNLQDKAHLWSQKVI